MASEEKILSASAKHPQPGRVFSYGTSGFRTKADQLDAVVFRVGLLASLRSRKLNGQTIGVMITASHNPPEDNGIKLVDPMGEMLETSWEAYATELANAPSDQALLDAYLKLIQDIKIKPEATSRVVLARDTRTSGPALVAALVDALDATNTHYDDFSYMTTPQLHYVTRCVNTLDTPVAYGEPSETGYYRKLASAFKNAMSNKKTGGTVVIDCANGVGGPKLKELVKYLPTATEGGINIKILNDDISQPDILNDKCGADFVKVNQRPPLNYKHQMSDRFCSLDGDADRLMYYYTDPDDRFVLLDGDRIATLAASFLGTLASHSGLDKSLHVGVVQTAYANGASTEYITKTLKLPVVCTPTGVKHLHHAAQSFDIGVYFEANGHGTVLFSPQAIKTIHEYQPQTPAQQMALETLKSLIDLINQTVGDALSDMLLVETILAHKSWGPKEWEATYKDLPNRLGKAEVPDRNVFKTIDAERKLETPQGLQGQIDALVGRYEKGRAFARASGTEDLVRIYAEAATRSEAEDLCSKVVDVVKSAGQSAVG